MAAPDSAAGPVDDESDVLAVDELDSAAIAAAMGFSSFGSQAHPNKKRRFNPRVDAVVSAGGGGGGHSSSSNTTTTTTTPSVPAAVARPSAPSSLPLHHPPLHGGAGGANDDEIALDLDADDDDNDDDRGPQYVDTSRPVGEVRCLGEVLREGDGSAVAEADGTDGGPEEDAAARQARIDAVLAAGNAAYGMSPAAAAAAAAAVAAAATANQLDGSSVSTARHPGAAGQQRQIRAIDRHGFRSDLAAPGGEDGSARGGGSSSSGGGRPPWWTDYYDPTSNENPWARLEADLGMPATGRWLTRHGAQHQGPGSPAAAPL